MSVTSAVAILGSAAIALAWLVLFKAQIAAIAGADQMIAVGAPHRNLRVARRGRIGPRGSGESHRRHPSHMYVPMICRRLGVPQ